MKFKLIGTTPIWVKGVLTCIMRIFVFLFCATLFSFNHVSSQNVEIKIAEDKIVTVDKVFEIIKKQTTDFMFIYPKNLFEAYPKVQLRKGTITIEDLLDLALSEGNVDMTLTDNNIIIIKKKDVKENSKVVRKRKNEAVEIKGRVIDADKNALSYVNVIVRDLNIGTFTNMDGEFSLELPHKNFELELSLIGFKTEKIAVSTLPDLSNVVITLKEDLLSLDEIVVTAKKTVSREGTSTYKIGSQAIKQVQAMNLSDVLSLLPGNKIEQTDLTTTKQANLRSAVPSKVNAFGTAIILDGAAISTDANMQTQNSGSLSGGKSVVAGGVDLRSISLANVESVEVISGIASPKYGNISSGGILVKSKVGKSPYIVSANVSSTNYQASVAKGYDLNKFGILNSDLSYAHSSGSPTERKLFYQSFNLGLRWKLPVFENLDWNHFTSLRVSHSDDGNRHEPEEVYKNEADVKSTSYQATLSGNFKSSLLGKLNYNFSGSVVDQHSYYDTYVINGPFPIIEAIESGTYTTGFSPTAFNQTRDIKGRPVNLNGRLDATQNLSFKNLDFNFETGLQYTFDDNTGSGRVATGNIAHTQDVVGSRSATFEKIPASKTFSAYHQTIIKRKAENSKQQLNLGLRYDNMLERYNLISPRMSFSSNHHNFTGRVAWGVSYKAPAMIQLYPGRSYIDYINYQYYAENPDERLAVVTTYIYQPTNEHLKPNYSDVKEVGFDWSPSFMNLNVTYFKKDMRRGINTTEELLLLPKVIYEVVDAPTGQQPTVEPTGEVYNIPRSVNVMKNNYYESTDGVEVTLNPERIKATNTEFNFRYSYLKSVVTDKGFNINKSAYVVGDNSVRFGVYENALRKAVRSFGTVTLIQHIPSLRFVLTLSAELNFKESSDYIGTSLYPFAYYDTDGNYIAIPEENRTDPEFADLKKNDNTYTTVSTPFYSNFNLQIRKETKQGHSFSFFAINAPWYNPTYDYLGNRRTLNSKLSVGFNATILINNKTNK
ncbi:TonB-dependent receptor [Maribacter sp. MMG018]|uniref:TonB-dependent receptor n=1 Tax=Maribacter sp. MMG018 TaxID=2822688 RepID=UPI001B389972|nr:carboxypeptidase-like regulatory domain-containing protein [Maribacter sp. MMG018]MBQ4915099.1 TonB-dependent receptor [Maribacter sp. MMG018]